uniref:Uncharacterized protein n=1 Tax=Aegilops tauschii subsp. strangulata TaxID=200361 RepID=A0A453NUT4_AEGTS
MVSLRRRRLLGLCSGKDSLPVDLPKPVENEKHGEVEHANVNPLSVHPLPLTRTSDVLPESSNGSDSLKEEKNQYYPGLLLCVEESPILNFLRKRKTNWLSTHGTISWQ